jgi:hypothetical protein
VNGEAPPQMNLLTIRSLLVGPATATAGPVIVHSLP